MSLCRPRRLTPASLAARRANALKSTGPRTVRGKARAGFNALKLGLHAARSARLRDRLIRAGYDRQEALYGHIRSRIAQTFGASTPEHRSWCDGVATQVWCLAIRSQSRRQSARTKLKSNRKQMGWGLRTSSHQQIGGAGNSDDPGRNSDTLAGNNTTECDRLDFGIQDPWRRIGLRFWVQRKRYWTVARMRRMLSGETLVTRAAAGAGGAEGNAPAPPSGGPPAPIADTLHGEEWLGHRLGRRWNEGLERAVRSRVFRLAKPGWIERRHYSLKRNGDPDWEREPWKSALALRRPAESQERAKRVRIADAGSVGSLSRERSGLCPRNI